MIYQGGGLRDILPYMALKSSMVTFKYTPQYVGGDPGLRRRELSSLLDTIGGPIILDGPRRMRSAYVIRGGREVGSLISSLFT